ncbi:MFS transporter [Sphingomonas sp.]|uniref:MFS transporter n=1 Tax=Sphingomonas sp. TaxID=28214 RepID=UPI000DB4A63F|nr:MFS transporter [Sphingomonas sp.]PZU10186.1 MAG: MFS transporter [Sphingomonas sp.]
MTIEADESYHFAPHERPAFPGSPFTPSHPLSRRVGYAGVALLAGIGATFGNGLVTVNVANLGGPIGLYAFEVSLLPAIYVAFNASANLMLVRGRAQFGIPAITQGLLCVYALAALVELMMPGPLSAMLIRAVCGMTAAALLTFSIYNWMQAMPLKARPLGLILAIGASQLGPALARLVPVDLLTTEGLQGLALIELGIALAVLAAAMALPLPPSERSKAFQPLDFVTYPLVLVGMLLLCTVLSEGRLLWWTDTPWLGVALAVAVLLFCAAGLMEHLRGEPLLRLRWLGSSGIRRFAIVALLVRLALAEQTYGAVGLLTSGGLNNDQLHLLFGLVALAMVAGTIAAIVTVTETRLPIQVMVAALIIAAGSWLDSSGTNLTRPPQLYLSQSLIAFGTTLFIGPALLYGFLQVLRQGGDHLVSFIVLFGTTQNLGGLAGSALLGTIQVIRTRAHALALSEHVLPMDPQVAQRIQGGAASLSGTIVDPGLQAAQGGGLLGQAITREATILAYNDVFWFVTALALATAAYIALTGLFVWFRAKPDVAGAAA